MVTDVTNKSNSQDIRFDKRGNKVITINKRMMQSRNYLTLSSAARSLMIMMHTHWQPNKYTDYGVREAAENLGSSQRTAMRVFDELQTRGFIVCMITSSFSSRTNSKTRSWNLTWLPYIKGDPTHEWEEWVEVND